MPLLSIIVPIYNEEKILDKSLPPIFNLVIDKEVIIVNDGSSDDSLKVLRDLSHKYDFQLLNLATNQGKGSAIRQGLGHVNGKYFAICDADMEYNPKELAVLLDRAVKLGEEKIAVYGSRYLSKSKFSWHYLVNKFLTVLTNLLYGAKLTDMETCLKLIPAEALGVFKLTADRFDIEPQITAQLLKNHYQIHDVGIGYQRRNYQQGKKIKAKDGFEAMWMLVKERFKSPASRPKRIGIDARFYGPIGKGLGRYTKELADHLVELDTANEYVIFLRRDNFDEFNCHSPRVKKVLADIGWYGLNEQLLFPFYIWRERLDLMHFPHFNVPLLCPVKFIVTIHDLILLKFPTERATTIGPWLYKIKNLAYRIVIAAAVKRTQMIIAVSQFTKQEIINHFPIKSCKVEVIYEGITRLPAALGVEQAAGNLNYELSVNESGILDKYGISGQYFLYIGNAYPHKNLEGLIKTFAKINRTAPEPKLVLVGKEDYFYKRIKAFASVHILCDQLKKPTIVFPGFVPDGDLAILYKHAVAYIAPAYYEGFGLPALEAMAHGCPVVSSNKTSLPEILGAAALYFNPDDETEMLERILSVSHERLRQELVGKGYEQIKKYSWQECAQKTLALYNSYLEK